MNLFVACQAREGDLENIFTHENHCYPVSVSEYGRLRKGTAKSDFLECVEEWDSSSLEPPEVEAKTIDGPAFININTPKTSRAFREYCSVQVTEKVRQILQCVVRLDFVFDTYKSDSIKEQTRENRGKSIRISVRKETPICRQFQDFMRHDANKTELFKMLPESMTHLDTGKTTIIATSLENAAANTVQMCNHINYLSTLQECSHEEVDSCVLLHVFYASNKGLQKVLIVTFDTDVVINALYHFFSSKLEELWVEICVSQHRRWLPMHKHAAIL